VPRKRWVLPYQRPQRSAWSMPPDEDSRCPPFLLSPSASPCLSSFLPLHLCLHWAPSTPAPLQEEFIPRQGGGERLGQDICMQRMRWCKRTLVPKCLPLAAAAPLARQEVWVPALCAADPTPEEGETLSRPCVDVHNPISCGRGHVLVWARPSLQG
jgi:hypothetical protein